MDDWQILDVPKNSSLEAIRASYLRLSKLHHPDIGGDAEKFIVVKLAYDRLVKQLTTPRACPACKGLGTAYKTYGFHSILVTCPDCGGDGKICKK